MDARTAIVLPVYDQERWLARALDSLLAQTCREFVVIAVDDGSTDASPEILRRYAQAFNLQPSTFNLVSQANAGVSAARNAGLEAALAVPDVDSVMFLDPDDRYLPTCVEKARRAHVAAPDAVVEWAFATSVRPSSSFSSPDRLEPNVWCKLYPREIVSDVRFCEETNIAEDLAFNLEVEHRHRPRLVRIDEPLYFYEDNSGSAMHRPLTARDFTRRAVVIRHILSVFEGDPQALDAVCRDEVPELLKQFHRALARVPQPDRPEARRIFVGMLRDLHARGLLHPKRGRLKELRHYLRFRLMARGGAA